MSGLEDRPYEWAAHGEEVQISHRGKPVTRLRGEAAARFLARVRGLEADAAQQLMARATGNFKRGNERRGSC
jgi:antitoxin (DNA-binding transcriptional repressor) of toxin-antitoxin stability system